MITLQEIFDNGVRGVIAQGQPSTHGRYCRYRANGEASDTVRCALGHSIPDDKYKLDYDCELGFEEMVKELGWYHLDFDTLREFQKCHDDASSESDFIESFKSYARGFAQNHHLNQGVLNA